MPKRDLTVISTAGIAVVVLCMLYGYQNIQSDDTYIFYSYAKNIAEGHGYVFNVGERVNATTSPLYTLLLALLYRVFRFVPGLTVPLLGHIIGAVSLFFVGIFLMRSFRMKTDSLFPWALPLVFLANPALLGAIGMELFLAMALATGCLAFYHENRRRTAALFCALAVLGRIDMILFAAVLLSYDLIRYRRLPTLGMSVTFVLPLAAWLIFSWVYFGNLLPTTVAAKLAQTEAGLWGEGPVFLKGLFSGARLCDRVSSNREVVPIVLALLTAGAIAAAAGLLLALARLRTWHVLRHPVFQLILLWNVSYLIVYGIVIDAPAYSWYYTPLTLGMALLMTAPFEGLRHGLAQRPATRSPLAPVGILLALVVVAVILPLANARMPVTPRHETHRQAAEWLNANVADGTSVGANDIGVFRFYYEKGPIIDGGGLVTPEVVDHLKRHEYGWYLHEYLPDYLTFLNPPRSLVRTVMREEWFQAEYALVTTIGERSSAVTIYRRHKP